MDFPDAAIEQCINGHIFCGDCLSAHKNSGRGDASNKCPTCRVALGDVPIRNRIAESAVGNLPGACGGCGTEMLRKNLADHQNTCGEVSVQCPFPGCTEHVKRKDLDRHMASAAAAHLALAQAQANELQAKKDLLAGLDVIVKLKLPHQRSAVTVNLKRFEPVAEQPAFVVAVSSVPRRRVSIDASKTPHELNLRDGTTIDVTSAPDPNAHLNIKVVSQYAMPPLFFKIKHTTPMVKLFDAWSNRCGVHRGSVRFLFDGQRIRENQTAAQLGMEDDDVINVVVERMG